MLFYLLFPIDFAGCEYENGEEKVLSHEVLQLFSFSAPFYEGRKFGELFRQIVMLPVCVEDNRSAANTGFLRANREGNSQLISISHFRASISAQGWIAIHGIGRVAILLTTVVNFPFDCSSGSYN